MKTDVFSRRRLLARIAVEEARRPPLAPPIDGGPWLGPASDEWVRRLASGAGIVGPRVAPKEVDG